MEMGQRRAARGARLPALLSSQIAGMSPAVRRYAAYRHRVQNRRAVNIECRVVCGKPLEAKRRSPYRHERTGTVLHAMRGIRRAGGRCRRLENQTQ